MTIYNTHTHIYIYIHIIYINIYIYILNPLIDASHRLSHVSIASNSRHVSHHWTIYVYIHTYTTGTVFNLHGARASLGSIEGVKAPHQHIKADHDGQSGSSIYPMFHCQTRLLCECFLCNPGLEGVVLGAANAVHTKPDLRADAIGRLSPKAEQFLQAYRSVPSKIEAKPLQVYTHTYVYIYIHIIYIHISIYIYDMYIYIYICV